MNLGKYRWPTSECLPECGAEVQVPLPALEAPSSLWFMTTSVSQYSQCLLHLWGRVCNLHLPHSCEDLGFRAFRAHLNNAI